MCSNDLDDFSFFMDCDEDLFLEDDPTMTFSNDHAIKCAESLLSGELDVTGAKDVDDVIIDIPITPRVAEDDDVASGGDDDDDEDFKPCEEESSLIDTWVPSSRKSTPKRLRAPESDEDTPPPKKKRRSKRAEIVFVSRVVEGSTHTIQVPWTMKNLMSLWDSIVKKGSLQQFLSTCKYLHRRRDGTYYPTSLGMKRWALQASS